jgi:hypothetical protein
VPRQKSVQKTVPSKRPDRPQFTQAERRWFTTTFKALPRQQQTAIGLLVETYADGNAAAARKAVR